MLHVEPEQNVSWVAALATPPVDSTPMSLVAPSERVTW